MSFQQAYDAIEEVLKEYDAKYLKNLLETIPTRLQAVREAKAGPRTNVYDYYAKVYAAAGGKTWYQILEGRNLQMINEYVTKLESSKVKQRNAKIAVKLQKAEITEIADVKYQRSSDGYTGIWVVNTNNGVKRIKLEIIIAGGYNIQCLHYRTLVSVK